MIDDRPPLTLADIERIEALWGQLDNLGEPLYPSEERNIEEEIFAALPALLGAARDGLKWREHITKAMRSDPNWRQNLMGLDYGTPPDRAAGEEHDVQPDSD